MAAITVIAPARSPGIISTTADTTAVTKEAVLGLIAVDINIMVGLMGGGTETGLGAEAEALRGELPPLSRRSFQTEMIIIPTIPLTSSPIQIVKDSRRSLIFTLRAEEWQCLPLLQ